MSQETLSTEWNEIAETILRNMAGSAVRVESIEPWGIGALNTCLKVVAKKTSGVYFLKVENEHILPSTRRGQIAREVASIQRMQSAGIPCPTVLRYDCSGGETGRRYLLEAFIDAELFWEIREIMTDQEREILRADMAGILKKMNTITSPLFGDVYPGGVVGKHSTWRAAYQAMARLLLNDSCELELLNIDEAQQVEAAMERSAEALVATSPAGFYHGDLGLHNVMVDRSHGFARLGTVIDFGNALFLQLYRNDVDTRRYGGFGLDSIDAASRCGISQQECAANDLLMEFDATVFHTMLRRRHGHGTDDLKAAFFKKI